MKPHAEELAELVFCVGLAILFLVIASALGAPLGELLQ